MFELQKTQVFLTETPNIIYLNELYIFIVNINFIRSLYFYLFGLINSHCE